MAQSQLRKPLIVVGRSPTCDVVLRAPGIKPIHYIIEWIGSGVFDPRKGNWSIVDVSSNAEAGEGQILGPEGITLGDILFRVQDSKLESSEVIGGKIVEGLGQRGIREAEILEFVQVRTDSGAIEEVQHIPLSTKAKIEPVSREFKTFKVEHTGVKQEHLLNVLLDEMPGAELLLSGRRIDARTSLPLRPMDFLQVKWNHRDFYLRFVEEVDAPPIPRDFWGDPLLKRLTLGAIGLVFLMVGSYVLAPKEEEKPEPELPRVARVEIPATPAPPPPAPETPVVEAASTAEKDRPQVQKKDEKKPAKPEVVVKSNKAEAPAKAAAPKVVKAPDKPVKAGLNTNAPASKDVNQVGLLAALNKSARKGEGVKADKLLNEGLIRESATSQDNSRVVLRNPPAGVIGSGDGGAPNGSNNKANLGQASTTLSGVKKADPNSNGLIARKGGESGFNMGSSASGTGKSIGGQDGGGIGGMDGSDFSVAGGGLDRETVRRIIASYRSQIRTCYERALIGTPNLHGRVVYQWRITPIGNVITAQVTKATAESSSLKTCVLEVIQKMQFPKAPNGLPTTVIYPFVFQGKN
jgi:outer membrane biosynthesis protein TonB